MNKTEIIQKIKQLDGLSNDERAYLVELVNTKKKYGLVWEDKPEDVEEQLRTHLPVLKEVTERRIEAPPQPSPVGREPKKAVQNLQQSLFEPENIQQSSSSSSPSGGGREGAVNHILIEGDNLHALTALTFTHEGKIDVMYFDPPYNTGNKDFKYNDSFVDREDSYRHSKWLSFMDKRLRIAKRLLSEKGVVFISIDVNEIAQLKILCDSLFGEENLINIVANINNPKGRSDEKNIATANEYLLCYKKSSIDFQGWPAGVIITKRYNKIDEKGLIYREIDLRKTGDNDKRSDRPNLFYYFLHNPITRELYPTKEENVPTGFIQIKPLRSDMSEGNWRWSIETSLLNIDSLIPKFMEVRKKYTVFEKDILIENQKVKATTVWNQKEVNSERGSEQFQNLGFDKNQFPKPKPLGLINLILELIQNSSCIILDFFAGSGTTLHATMQLNAEDGGNRQCILVTNNENNIAEEVCYERNRRVIQGYTNSKDEWVPGLTNNNLRYYKSEFVESAKTEENRRKLTQLSSALLQIKEDCYEEVVLPDTVVSNQAQAFTNGKGKYLLVVYHHRKQTETSATLTVWIKQLTGVEGKIKLYAFSPETEILVNDFIEVAEKIDPIPLPDAIYNAYRNTFRTIGLHKRGKRKEKPGQLIENETEGLQTDEQNLNH